MKRVLRGILLASIIGAVVVGATRGPDAVRWAQRQVQQVRQNIDDKVTDNHGRYDVPPPDGRSVETSDPNATASVTTPGDLPHVEPIVFSDVTAYPGFSNGMALDAYPDGDPSAGVQPTAVVSGYLVAKDKQPDGDYLFAVELPYLSGPQDILSRSGSTTTPELKATEIAPGFDPRGKIEDDNVGGAIVWLKLFPGEQSGYFPFTTASSYGEACFAPIGGCPSQSVTGPDALFAYARIGDPIRALAYLGMDSPPKAWSTGFTDYVGQGHAGSVSDAEAQMRTILDANLSAVKRLVADGGTTVSLADQLQGKRYVLTPDSIAFLPLGAP
jgi:hypothetical protein